jgi:hypothetical protein
LRSTSISRRRNSLLSKEVRANDIPDAPLGSPFSVTPVTPILLVGFLFSCSHVGHLLLGSAANE